MKRLVIKIPDSTQCAFLNYVYTEGGERYLCVQAIDEDAIKDGHVTVEPPKEEE